VSREIAELTGKTHKNVLRDCDGLNEKYGELHLLNFEKMFSIRKLPNGGKERQVF
jgi:phage regulator Rha-like protein